MSSDRVRANRVVEEGERGVGEREKEEEEEEGEEKEEGEMRDERREERGRTKAVLSVRQVGAFSLNLFKY